MKYCIKNDLSLFEFHDSQFSFVSYDGVDLVISASMVNIHKHTPQNPSDCDMEIASAEIIFKNFNSATYEPGRTWKTGEDGVSYPVGPIVVYNGRDAISRIIEELKEEIKVFHFVKGDDCRCSIGGCGIEPYFEIEFEFDDVAVCWEEYKKKAWYELHRQYKYNIVLHTPNSDHTVPLIIGCHEEPVYHNGKLKYPPIVDVACKLEGNEYYGYGSDYLWIDAFADLQRKLPTDVILKCCLTCRHGNLCPVGDNNNEVFCTKDVQITQKSDLYFYTEDEDERAKRSRQYCNVCEEFQTQSDEYYTYNDYFYFLKKGDTILE